MVNTGGNVSWQEGEVFGGFHLQGGTITLQANPTTSGGTAQNWTSGTVTTLTGTFMIQGNTAINKTTPGDQICRRNPAIQTARRTLVRLVTVQVHRSRQKQSTVTRDPQPQPSICQYQQLWPKSPGATRSPITCPPASFPASHRDCR